MPHPLCRGRVIESLALTHDVKQINVRAVDPPRLEFKAGQYIAFEVTEIRDGVTRKNNRPYSIASPPEQNDVLELCVNLVKGGPGSSFLHALHPGDEVTFLYPLGYFTLNEASRTDILFVATGTGIAPFRSMIHHLLRNGTERNISLYWGLRSEKDIYYWEEFEALARIHVNFRPIITLSKPTDGWTGPRGRVTGLLPKVLASVENLEAYLCGNGEMIKEIRTFLIEGKGMSRKVVHYEKFF